MAIAVTGLGAAFRSLRGDLHSAADRQLTEVVAMLDLLADRGEADALIAGLRPRLARLRPPRPPGFHRIMFSPFDPLIVPTADWVRNSPGVPRTIMRPLGDLVRRQAAAQMVAIDAALAAPDPKLLEIGRIIWALAADILSTSNPPPDWQQASGLRDADFAPLCQSLATILRHAASLDDMIAAEATGELSDAAHIDHPMLKLLAESDTRTTAMLTALLMARLPAENMGLKLKQILAADIAGPTLPLAVDQAQEFLVHKLEATAAPSGTIDQAPAEMERLVSALETQRVTLRDRPALLNRVNQARSRLDVACRARFGDMLTSHILAPLDRIEKADAVAIEGIEHDARALRRFDLAARRLGGAASYDQALRATAAKLRPGPDESVATRVDKLRLAEILLGSAAAADLG
jgi:hypothetical protein